MTGGYWHFQCPECGMGDFELGHLAADQEFRLRSLPGGRPWPDPPPAMAGQGNDAPDYALFRPGLAA